MHKKHTVFVLWSLVLILVLAACASQAGGSTAEAETSATTEPAASQGQRQTRQAPDMANQPIEQKLAIGTLQLEGSDQAITAEQAKTLLPLWKAVKVMTSDSSTASEELSALYSQIQESMTAEQVQAIQDLKLAPEDTQALMEEYGIEMPQGGPGNLSEEERATRVAQFQAQGDGAQGGGFPGGDAGRAGGPPAGGEMGGPPADGGAVAGGQQPRAQGTPAAGRPNRGFGGGMNSLFVDPLIELLQQRAGD